MKNRWLMGFLVVNLTLGGAALGSIYRYGSIRRAIDVWDGRVIHADDQDIEIHPGDKTFDVTFQVKNDGSRPVQIAGCFIGCIGLPMSPLPFMLGPGEQKPVSFQIKCTAKSYAQRKRTWVKIFTTSKEQPEIKLYMNVKGVDAES